MERLTINKEVSEMNMMELAHNSCFAKDQNATYRDFECEIDARDFIRKIGLTFGVFENDCEELTDDEAFDEVMTDCLQYGYDEKEGLLALLYRNLWAQANLYERLKRYEDLEEQRLLPKLPCKFGTKVYILRKDIKKIIDGEVIRFHIGEFMSTAYVFITDDNRYTEITFDNFGKTVFLTQVEAEEALKRKEGEE